MTNPILISKLAAILAADVVGFSLKMGENEYLTIKNLKACRSIVDSAIKNIITSIIGMISMRLFFLGFVGK